MKHTEKAAFATALPSRSSPAADVTLTVAARASDRDVSAATPSTSAEHEHRDQREMDGDPGQREEHQRLEPVQGGQHRARPAPVEARYRRRRYQRRRELRGQEERRGPECAAGAAIDEQRERQRADHEGQLVQRVGSQKPPICAESSGPGSRGHTSTAILLPGDLVALQAGVGPCASNTRRTLRHQSSFLGRLGRLAAVILCGDDDQIAVVGAREHLCPQGFPARAAGRAARGDGVGLPAGAQRGSHDRPDPRAARSAARIVASSTRSSSSITRATAPPRSPAGWAPRCTTRTSLMPELGPVLGKGDAMWRALPVLNGRGDLLPRRRLGAVRCPFRLRRARPAPVRTRRSRSSRGSTGGRSGSARSPSPTVAGASPSSPLARC